MGAFKIFYEQKLTAKVREDYDQIMGNNQEYPQGLLPNTKSRKSISGRLQGLRFWIGSVSIFNFFPKV
ncbi:MAG UNVERIFIED_CONTAM: hypothetical protein LVR29_10420 [Microcystis novacekii LVE1205-3]